MNQRAIMLRLIAVAAIVLGAAAVPVMGASDVNEGDREIAVGVPVQAASLDSGRLTMMLAYVPGPAGDFDVTATFVDRKSDQRPIDVRLTMQPGDQVTFRVPGYPEARYHFLRAGDRVIARVQVERLKDA